MGVNRGTSPERRLRKEGNLDGSRGEHGGGEGLIEEVIRSSDLEKVDELVTPDYENHDPTTPEHSSGQRASKYTRGEDGRLRRRSSLSCPIVCSLSCASIRTKPCHDRRPSTSGSMAAACSFSARWGQAEEFVRAEHVRSRLLQESAAPGTDRVVGTSSRPRGRDAHIHQPLPITRIGKVYGVTCGRRRRSRRHSKRRWPKAASKTHPGS